MSKELQNFQVWYVQSHYHDQVILVLDPLMGNNSMCTGLQEMPFEVLQCLLWSLQNLILHDTLEPIEWVTTLGQLGSCP